MKKKLTAVTYSLISRFSQLVYLYILQVTESWAVPGNGAAVAVTQFT